MDQLPISILLVEDNPCDAELLDFQLRVQGHRDTRIDWVQRLGPALERLGEGVYDLILLDLTLPDMEGLEVFLEVNRRAPSLPIVILTGLADARLALETVRRGAQDYLVKDEIEGRALMRSLSYAIERKKVQHQAQQLRQEAEEMQRRKSEFVAMVSHELRNPMTGIVGFVHLLGKTRLDPIQREYLEAVGSSAGALVDLLNNLLDFSSAESGHVSLDLQPLAIRECLENAACFFVPQAHSKGLEVVTNLDPTIPDLVLGDELRLRQVVVNLLSNAIKFTSQGYIGVSARVRASHDQEVVIRFVIEDSGRGIPEDKCKSIFQPFRQAESEDRSRGKGLGLAICQQLVQAMGGVVGVVSRPGFGTGFWFDLPFRVQVESSLTGRLRGIRAIVAEAHQPTLQAMAFVLEGLGAEVTLSSSEPEVREALHARTYDLILLGSIAERSRLLPSDFADDRPDWAPPQRWLVSAYEQRGQQKDACFISRPLRLGDLVSDSCPLADPLLSPTSMGAEIEVATGRLLVVDDDPVCRQLVVAVAGVCGVSCQTASSLAEALQALARETFRLVLLDHQLPDGSGLELAQHIRQRGLTVESTALVALSGSRIDGRPYESTLTKPVDPEQLTQVMRRWLFDSPEAPAPLVAPVLSLAPPPSIDWEVIERLKKYQRGTNSNLIRELLETYLRSCPARLSALEGALAEENFEEIRRVAHQLRGAATSVGAAAVGTIAEKLEDDPHQPEVVWLLQDQLKVSVDEFKTYLDKLEVEHAGPA